MRRHKLAMGVLALVCALLAATTLDRPATVHAATVPLTTCDEPSLRTAITNAGAGGTVTFGCSGTITLADTLKLLDSVTLDATGQTVALSGNNAVQVLNVTAGRIVALTNLTVTGGNTAPASNGAPGSNGGGIYNNGTLALSNSTVSGNSAQLDGAGIFNDIGGTVTLSNSTVSGNSAQVDGGGIFNDGTLTLSTSTVSGNSAATGTPNGPGTGGGIYNDLGTATLTNSTVSGNSAQVGGGGIYNQGTLTLTNSTISGNSAPGFNGGGGIFAARTLTLTNSIVAGNSGLGGATDPIADCLEAGGLITSGGHNVFGQGTGCPATASDVTVAPAVVTTTVLGLLAGNGGPTQTMALLAHSPAIDLVPAADAGCPATDQRGAKRPQGPACDAGAVEDDAPPPTLTTQASPGGPLGIPLFDTATLAGGASPTGTITFTLYGPNDATCANAAVFTSAPVTVTANGSYMSGVFTPRSRGTYRWMAAYSGDGGNGGIAGACNAANESADIAITGNGNGDGAVTAVDAVCVLRSVADLPTIAGIGQPC